MLHKIPAQKGVNLNHNFLCLDKGEHYIREIIGASEGSKEDKASWASFLRSLKERGLQGTQLFVRDKCLDLVEAVAVHFRKRNFSVVWYIFTGMCSLRYLIAK